MFSFLSLSPREHKRGRLQFLSIAVWVVLMIATVFPMVFCWGPDGHKIVAMIAQTRLNANALSYVTNALAPQYNGSMAAVANWADDIKNQTNWLWSAELHYADVHGDICTFIYSRDCVNSNDEIDRCVVGAISNYTDILKTTNPEERSDGETEALQFLIHFIGDIHQPLHIGNATDLGGNLINGTWYDESTNLHVVWDVNIIATRLNITFNNSLESYTSYLLEALSNGTFSMSIEQILSCQSANDNSEDTLQFICPKKWAQESATYACDDAYRGVAQNFSLGDEYYMKMFSIVDLRLAMAGVRLASSVNYIADSLKSSVNSTIIGIVVGCILGVIFLALSAIITYSVLKKRRRDSFERI